jgi:predicted HTH domain antitoxin
MLIDMMWQSELGRELVISSYSETEISFEYVVDF